MKNSDSKNFSDKFVNLGIALFCEIWIVSIVIDLSKQFCLEPLERDSTKLSLLLFILFFAFAGFLIYSNKFLSKD